LKINLPDLVDDAIPNKAGPGKGAYTGVGLDNLDITLDRKLKVPSDGNGRLTFKAYWDLDPDRDYGYVMIDDGTGWVFLDDLDGVFRESDPNGYNLGHGLTGSGNQKLRFDLSSCKGKTVTLRFRYRTQAGSTSSGWWLDDLLLNGNRITNFNNATPPAAFPGWTNSSPGWMVVPATPSHPQFYLVEWRAPTKYDKMLRTAYVTTFTDEDEWQVERIPYNIPGAVLYYLNGKYVHYLKGKYEQSYELEPQLTDAPSIGPKYPLLVVDMNCGPMRLGDTGIQLDARRGSYDAALTLQSSKPLVIHQFDNDGETVTGPWAFPSKPPVAQFDDRQGYYAGLYAGPPCNEGSFCHVNEGGSAVIPAFGNYSTRISHYDGTTPYEELYGQAYQGSILGTGNPGKDSVQHGVRIQLLKKSSDNRTATLRINGTVPGSANNND
jgi:immune inhibitor A